MSVFRVKSIELYDIQKYENPLSFYTSYLEASFIKVDNIPPFNLILLQCLPVFPKPPLDILFVLCGQLYNS